jgi:O-antigen/teichoic acid export membrane protein
VGWYGAADQLFGTLLFVPTVFMTAVFPALSRLHAGASGDLSRLMSRSFDLLLLISVPIGLGVALIANALVVLLFGDAFAQSGPILAVMGLVLILTYQNMLLGQFVISTDRQNVWTWVMAAAVALSIPLDLLLVPFFQRQFGNGAIGGAVAFIFTEAGMLLVGLRYLPPGALGRQNGIAALRVLLAGMVMLAATWWMRSWAYGWLLVYPILLGAVVYVAAVLLLRVVPAEDYRLLRGVMQHFWARLRRQHAQPAGS